MQIVPCGLGTGHKFSGRARNGDSEGIVVDSSGIAGRGGWVEGFADPAHPQLVDRSRIGARDFFERCV